MSIDIFKHERVQNKNHDLVTEIAILVV